MNPAQRFAIGAEMILIATAKGMEEYLGEKWLKIFLPLVPKLIELEGPVSGYKMLNLGQAGDVQFLLDEQGRVCILVNEEIQSSSLMHYLAWKNMTGLCETFIAFLEKHGSSFSSEQERLVADLTELSAKLSNLNSKLREGKQVTFFV